MHTTSNHSMVKLKKNNSFITFQFVGEWYEVERSFYLIESALKCTKINFSLVEDSNKLMVDVMFKLPW